MKINSILPLLLGLSYMSTSAAQNILTDYFDGNKDSLKTAAIKLIHMPEPVFKPTNANPVDPASYAEMGFEQVYTPETHHFITRDNKKLFAYKFPKPSQTTIILLHGVASTAYLYNKTAGLLGEATQAEVYALDFRGHGQSEGKAGDVDYINQYADDLVDIIAAINKEKPNGKIIIAAHSMGGGVALRYAMDRQLEQPDGFILFAPLLGQNSPAIPQGPEMETDSVEPFMKIHIERIIGLKMLNEIDNHEHDSLAVLFLNMPKPMPLRSYSYRANRSMAPDDYMEGLKAVKVPLLVLVGSEDEAFNAEALHKAVVENSNGKSKIVQGASHNGIRHSPKSFDLIKNWFSKLL
jgi:alpha-beta hydrolase superfamily lysophospholipase